MTFEAPALVLIQQLINAGASVSAYDPEAMEHVAQVFANQKGLSLVNSPQEALVGSDALILITEWKQFKDPTGQEIKSQLKEAVIYDGRNFYNPADLYAAGFEYYGIGRR